MARTIYTNYDDWKTDSDFDESAPLPRKSQCDCCGQFHLLTQVWYLGMETWACDACRGIEEEADDE